MIGSDVIRIIVAVSIAVIALILLGQHIKQSVYLWLESIQNRHVLAYEKQLPIKSGIRVSIGLVLINLSLVLLFTELLPLLPFGIAVALIWGLSTGLGIRRRQYYGRLLEEE